MTNELRLALSLSVGMHTAVLIGLPMTSAVQFDVERAPTSLEIYIVAPTPPAPAATHQAPDSLPDDVASHVVPQRPEPVPQTVIASERRGAMTEVLPSYLRNPSPVYPKLARERGFQGTVLLDVEVLPSGRCGQIVVGQSSGFSILDDAAAQAVSQWQFKPATRGRTPVPVRVEIPVTFRLVEELGG